MNICFIEDTPLHGGTQIWVTEAVKIYLESGCKITVLSPNDSWVLNECKKLGAKTVGYNYKGVIEKRSNDIEIWKKALINSDVAVTTVHPPRGKFHCSVFAAEVIKKCSLGTILIPKTGTIVPDYERKFYSPDPEISSHIIAITDFTRRYLINEYKIPEENVTLIYQGTDITSFNPDPELRKESEKKYALPQDSYPVVGCIGSFEERKGQSILIDSFKDVLKVFPNAKLMFVGDGPDENMLKKRVTEAGLEENIYFFPFTREPNLVFSRLDLLVLPSLFKEGLPNVLLESLAMGIPVVASEIAGVPEIVKNEKTGLLSIPGDRADLAEKIVRLCTDKVKMDKIGRYGRNFIRSGFDKKKQFGEFLNFFKKISGKN